MYACSLLSAIEIVQFIMFFLKLLLQVQKACWLNSLLVVQANHASPLFFNTSSERWECLLMELVISRPCNHASPLFHLDIIKKFTALFFLHWFPQPLLPKCFHHSTVVKHLFLLMDGTQLSVVRAGNSLHFFICTNSRNHCSTLDLIQRIGALSFRHKWIMPQMPQS